MKRNPAIKIFFLFFTSLNFAVISYSQVVYEPLYKNIYDFLGRLSTKGVIDYNDEMRPLPRKYIAEKILEAEKHSDLLSEVEKEDLQFYKKDYYHEYWFINNETNENHLNSFSEDPTGRWRIFSYGDDIFKMNLSLILGYEIGSLDNEKRTHLWNGLSAYGYISDNIGFSFDFRDNTEEGKTIDKRKAFTPITGVNARSSSNILDYPGDKLEYSETKGVVAVNWKWGSFAVGKEFFEWGYGESGLIVLSQKAPSFPFIRLDVDPVKWLGFNYFHGWLSSDVVDSSSFYYTSTGSLRFSYRNKYIASHSLFIRPLRGLKISLGESIIYSDKLEMIYFIPVIFFRSADHLISRQKNAAGGNSQFFISVSSRNHIKNTHLYGSLFIDELTLSGLFNSKKQRNQLGFLLGGSIIDFPIDNITLTFEYTRIYPFVYSHFNQTQTYTDASYVMGDWIGNNADQIYSSLRYRFIRGLEGKVWARYIRKGAEGNIIDQYTQPQPPFLFGLRTNYTYLGATLKYEFLNDLFFRCRYQFSKTSKEQDDHSFVDKDIHEFNFAIYYGM